MSVFMKSAQLMTALLVMMFFWLVYPGILVLRSSGVALVFILSAIGAIFGSRLAI